MIDDMTFLKIKVIKQYYFITLTLKHVYINYMQKKTQQNIS